MSDGNDWYKKNGISKEELDKWYSERKRLEKERNGLPGRLKAFLEEIGKNRQKPAQNDDRSIADSVTRLSKESRAREQQGK